MTHGWECGMILMVINGFCNLFKGDVVLNKRSWHRCGKAEVESKSLGTGSVSGLCQRHNSSNTTSTTLCCISCYRLSLLLLLSPRNGMVMLRCDAHISADAARQHAQATATCLNTCALAAGQSFVHDWAAIPEYNLSQMAAMCSR